MSDFLILPLRQRYLSQFHHNWFLLQGLSYFLCDKKEVIFCSWLECFEIEDFKTVLTEEFLKLFFFVVAEPPRRIFLDFLKCILISFRITLDHAESQDRTRFKHSPYFLK